MVCFLVEARAQKTATTRDQRCTEIAMYTGAGETFTFEYHSPTRLTRTTINQSLTVLQVVLTVYFVEIEIGFRHATSINLGTRYRSGVSTLGEHSVLVHRQICSVDEEETVVSRVGCPKDRPRARAQTKSTMRQKNDHLSINADC